MTNRRDFVKTMGLVSLAHMLPLSELFAAVLNNDNNYPHDSISFFCKGLQPVGRILETSGYYVWGCSPVYDSDGRVHVFYSRWPEKYGMGGWIHKSEIAHAVADTAESTFRHVGTVLDSRPGFFDSKTLHNPHIQFIDGRYYLFYMGNSDGSVRTKRIGLAYANSPYGPWTRVDKPLIDVGSVGAWDDCCTTNPAFIKHPSGEYRLYYKSWNLAEYENQSGSIRANRKYGLAVADSILGPFTKYPENPIVDFSVYGDNRQVEDAYVFMHEGKYMMLMRDMGYYDHTVGLIFESEDGVSWSKPMIAWFGTDAYIEQEPAPKYLSRYGRFERPQVLMKNGCPEYLFTTSQGGKYQTASGFVFKINGL